MRKDFRPELYDSSGRFFTMKVPDRCGSIDNWEHLTFIVVRKYIQDKEAKNIHETDLWE
mgnify:FL=1